MRPITLAFASLALAAPAFAHPGDHTYVEPLTHALGSADHLLPLALVTVAAVAVWRWSRR